MRKQKPKKTYDNLTLSLDPEFKKALGNVARICDRTISGYVKHLLKRAFLEDVKRSRTLFGVSKSLLEKIIGSS